MANEIQLWDNAILIVDNAIAVNPNCCCVELGWDCRNCDINTTPAAYEIKFEGVTNNHCNDCDASINGYWITLPQLSPIGIYPCYYVGFIFCNGFRMTIGLFINASGASDIEPTITLSDAGAGHVEYTKIIAGKNCNQDFGDLPLDTASSWGCNWSNSSCEVRVKT